MVINLTTTGGGSSTALGSSATQTATAFTVYDDAGRVVQSTDAAGHLVSYECDESGSQTVIAVVGGATRRGETGYDAAGRVIKSRDALNHGTVTVSDAGGRPCSTAIPWRTMSSTHDGLDPLHSSVGPPARGLAPSAPP